MRIGIKRDVWKRLLLLAVFVLVVAACSGSNDTVSGGTESSDTTATAAVSESATTAPPEAPTEDAAVTGEGDFSVVMVANTDTLTATNTLESLEAAGIEGFVLEGSAEEGFDVYRPGLTREEATDVLIEIATAPDVNGGLIFETANLP